jgi:hypothetical protein
MWLRSSSVQDVVGKLDDNRPVGFGLAVSPMDARAPA